MSYTPTTEQVRSFWASDGAHQPAAKSHDYIESAGEFDRWLASVKAEALREAAGIASSQAAEEWRLDRGEGMPGGVSKPGSQLIAMSLDSIASVIGNRADQIEREAPDA